MHRAKGTRNTPPAIIATIIKEHADGKSVRALSEEYGKPFKTVRNMIWRSYRKQRQANEPQGVKRFRGRKPAVTLQEYKYNNKRLQMENELLRDFISLAERR